MPVTKEWERMKGLFPTPVPSALQTHQLFSRGLRGKNVFSFPHTQASDSGMGCGTSFLWVQVRAQMVQSSSVIVFTALNFFGTTQPWQHQALCKSHCVTKTVYFYTVQTHICFPNDFGLKPLCFVAHKRVSGLIQGEKETNHPVHHSVCSTVCFLPFISACSDYQRTLLSCQQHNHFWHWGKHEMNYTKAQDPHFATLPYPRDSSDLMDNLSEKGAYNLTLTDYLLSPA